MEIYVRHLRRVREAADLEEDPYRGRLLRWAAEHWSAMESMAEEDAPGLYGTAYAALPAGLRADMQKYRASANPDRKLTAENRERMEINVLHSVERERTGSPCPETAAMMKELNRRGGPRITSDDVKQIYQEIVQASKVHEPKDLP
jgi:hypothetical protein